MRKLHVPILEKYFNISDVFTIPIKDVYAKCFICVIYSKKRLYLILDLSKSKADLLANSSLLYKCAKAAFTPDMIFAAGVSSFSIKLMLSRNLRSCSAVSALGALCQVVVEPSDLERSALYASHPPCEQQS